MCVLLLIKFNRYFYSIHYFNKSTIIPYIHIGITGNILEIKLFFDSDEHYSGFMVKRVIVSGSPNISTEQIEVKNKQVFVCKFDEGWCSE